MSILALLLFGRNNHSNLSGSIPEKIDQYLTNENFQGTVLIAKEDEVLFTKGYGLATTDLPNSQNGSHNKTGSQIILIKKQSQFLKKMKPFLNKRSISKGTYIS